MTDSNPPIVLVICNDYGELAFALYLLANQSFALNATLMLPPRLHAQNANVLPGRTLVYHSLEDVQKQIDGSSPGILGLFSGYLLPIHGLCTSEELSGLFDASKADGWNHFTSDPFLGLLGEVEPSELLTIKAPKFSFTWSFLTAIKKARLESEAQVQQSTQALTVVRDLLKDRLHVYPCGNSPKETDEHFGTRFHFHNPDIFLQPERVTPTSPDLDTIAVSKTAAAEKRRWLFVLGSEDYKVQQEYFGKATEGISPKFRRLLIKKLKETLNARRWPTLIAPANVIEAVKKHCPVADAMELLPHCEYSEFHSLLRDAEYVFYWNAVSFSCIPRTLTGKPWFTFDDGHLLRGMNTDYARRITDWFYRGDEPPRLDINDPLTSEGLLTQTKQYLKTAARVRQALLASPESRSLISALDPASALREANALQEAFDIVKLLGEIVSANRLDGSLVVDTALLSYPKSGFKAAVKLLLEKGIADQAAFARSAAPTLAFFQPGIGAATTTLDSPGLDGKPWRETIEAEMVAITKSMQQ